MPFQLPNPRLKSIIEARNKALLNAMYVELQDITRNARKYHQRIVGQWSNKPDFRMILIRSAKEMSGKVVIPDGGRIWRYVDEGTGGKRPGGHPYFIFPKPPNTRLSFRAGYSSRTRAIGKFNVGSGKALGAFVSKPFVLHPGITPRKFTKEYADSLRKTFRKRILNALGKVR